MHGYAQLAQAIGAGMSSTEAAELLRTLWAERYSAEFPVNLIEDLAHGSASYLFDRAGDTHAAHPDRTIAAYGWVERPADSRDNSYQAGFPMLRRFGQVWDRGHMVAHSSGGLFGPNLFPQTPALNRGWSDEGRSYRAMESRAAAGELFFFCALRCCDDSDVPAVIELGLVENRELTVRSFHNRFDAVALAAHPREPLTLLACFTSAQLADLGEETVRAHLADNPEAMIIALGDSRAPRSEGRQDLDLVVALDGELVAIEVKTSYFAARAGTLTKAGNLRRPRFGRSSTGHRQGTVEYSARRLTDIAEMDGEPRIVMCAVDLRARLLQFFDVRDGRVAAPLAPPEDCTAAVLAAMEEIPERLRLT